jgi:hypothetical protein
VQENKCKLIPCPKVLRLSKPTDMTIHLKALEEHFLMVPLVSDQEELRKNRMRKQALKPKYKCKQAQTTTRTSFSVSDVGQTPALESSTKSLPKSKYYW